MIGSRLRQALSLPLALAFTLGLLGGAYGFHGCPSHGSGGHQGHGPDAGGPAGPAAGQLPAEDVGVPLALGADGERDGDAGAGFCICIGSCHAGAAAAHPGAGSVDLSEPVPALHAIPRVAGHVPPYETPAYFLPYALGPPAA